MGQLGLTSLDLGIIVFYLVAVTAIGFAMRRKAAKSVESYLLGGKDIPWYMLGLSNASGMFDISGTMWLVTIGFVYGLKSIWLPWLWPTFNQIFLMVFLSAWLRRSNVTTGAQWIETRFGTGTGARLSHTVVVVFALIGGLGFLAYGFVGLGKFVEIFLPWEVVQPLIGINVAPEFVPHIYGIVFTLAAVLYTILGGMRSIVLADVLQFTIMTISAIVVAAIAMTALAHTPLAVPDGWMSPWFGWELDLDWTGIITEVNQKIVDDQFGLFTIFFMMMLFKGILVSAAGPAPNYDMQKILATRSPREGALMSGFVSLVLSPSRYLMITGFVVLGLLFYQRLDLIVGGQLDFEQILPSAINEFVPAGFTGLLLAGLAAAFVSTFSGTLNAAQAYVVNDLYHKYIDPNASQKRTVIVNYASGLLIVVVSIVLGFYAKNVNNMLQWIVSALWGAYLSSNVLKWYWWRFNGHGYFWGMAAGIVPALIFPAIWPDVLPLFYFPHLMGISLVGCIAGTYLTKPTDRETLKTFYRTVRPWGFWGPIRREVEAEDPDFKCNINFKRDMVNVVVGTIWQTALVALPIYFVLMRWRPVAITAVIVVVTMIFLKKNWYDQLED
ncbi:MAG: Na+:solute symporter [Acidobacteria bacterium]|jgi:SSS family solute:Na+ symporter|nr:Na+:solute symporter [Acidobacteriota bacterium]